PLAGVLVRRCRMGATAVLVYLSYRGWRWPCARPNLEPLLFCPPLSNPEINGPFPPIGCPFGTGSLVAPRAPRDPPHSGRNWQTASFLRATVRSLTCNT